MKEAANALGAKTARACDSCLRRRARWFCGADDAFLCHACDNIVHCANQLASRHERVRLQQQEGWYSGFTRKARTPRGHNNKNKYKEEGEALFMTTSSSTLSVVPEMAAEEETEEELLLCRVPEFDPDELCEIKKDDIDHEAGCGVEDLENFPEFMDLAEFAADVESLLQVGFDCNRDGTMVLMKNEIKDEQVVVEVENNDNNNNNNNNSTGTGEMERTQNPGESSSSASGIKGKILLRLNYEEVISAWDSQAQGCPWTTGNPPHLNSQLDFLCMGWSGDMNNVEEWGGYAHKQIDAAGGGREARVSRYREKRRTRLFAKKIRYQVRKLNAEKRPRMKGRFVKRASFLPTSPPTAAA